MFERGFKRLVTRDLVVAKRKLVSRDALDFKFAELPSQGRI